MSSRHISDKQRKILLAGIKRPVIATVDLERIRRLAVRRPALVKRLEWIPGGVRYKTTEDGLLALRYDRLQARKEKHRRGEA